MYRTTPGAADRRLGRQLRKLRHQHGYSLRDVGHICGINPGVLCLLEQGKRKLRLPHLPPLMKAYGLEDQEAAQMVLGLLRPRNTEYEPSRTER
jgi:transcriptional regulator with XRE-family HTH domain